MKQQREREQAMHVSVLASAATAATAVTEWNSDNTKVISEPNSSY
jgi:hypothetical protein